MESSKVAIEYNEKFLLALRLMEDSSRNVFVTGRAGTGKSTLLQLFRGDTKKNAAVLAPTGVAAVNIKGQTIHSFFNFRPDVTPDKVRKIRPRDRNMYKKLDAIVIDEISMVRADMLDCVDLFLRIHGRNTGVPFGGIQMIFIGDLYQLPPVVTSREKALFSDHYQSPFFFSARVFDKDLFSEMPGQQARFEMEFIELEKVYRQKDTRFLKLLNAIRNNRVTDDDMKEINSRCFPDFAENRGDFYIYLTTTNAMAEAVNQSKLSELKAEEHTYQGMMSGEFEIRSLPTSQDLALREGSQVMLLNNDSLGRWINGSIGRVADISKEEDGIDVIWVELPDGNVVDVLPYTWEMYEFSYDKKTSQIVSESVGAFTQYPLRLAWAVTIHKSQGMTFDRVIIDIGRGTFSHGQLYVALSRCTGINGLILKKPVYRKHVLLDRRIVAFLTRYQYDQAGKKLSMIERRAILESAIKDRKKIEIVYLKAGDEKSKRTIIPSFAGEMEYKGRKFPGIKALCTSRQEERVFHMERILEMRLLE